MKKRLIPIVVVLMAALLFSSSCTGRSVPVPFSDAKAEYLSGLPTEKAPSPDPSPSVPPTPRPTPSPTPSPSPTPVPYEGEEIAQYALQFNGYRYNYGGMDPSTGFDCSGLVYYVFRQFGYKLNRVAADQALNGIEVKTKADLLPATSSVSPGLQTPTSITWGFISETENSSMRWIPPTTLSSRS